MSPTILTFGRMGGWRAPSRENGHPWGSNPGPRPQRCDGWTQRGVLFPTLGRPNVWVVPTLHAPSHVGTLRPYVTKRRPIQCAHFARFGQRRSPHAPAHCALLAQTPASHPPASTPPSPATRFPVPARPLFLRRPRRPLCGLLAPLRTPSSSFPRCALLTRPAPPRRVPVCDVLRPSLALVGRHAVRTAGVLPLRYPCARTYTCCAWSVFACEVATLGRFAPTLGSAVPTLGLVNVGTTQRC